MAFLKSTSFKGAAIKKNVSYSQQSSSNESQLVLSSVSPATSGKFTCEVSADFPSFHTNIVSGDMEVVGKSSKLVAM